jgi:hypothetical protein
MSYGISVFNELGEQVISNTNSTFSLTKDETLTGVAYSHDGASGFYRHRFSTEEDALVFASLDIGDWVCFGISLQGQSEFFTSSQTVRFKHFRPSLNLPRSTDGYGIEVFADNGDVLFSSSRELLDIKGEASLVFQGASNGLYGFSAQAPAYQGYACFIYSGLTVSSQDRANFVGVNVRGVQRSSNENLIGHAVNLGSNPSESIVLGSTNMGSNGIFWPTKVLTF